MAATAKPAASGPPAAEHSLAPAAAAEHLPVPAAAAEHLPVPAAAAEHLPVPAVAAESGPAPDGQDHLAPIRLRPLTVADLPLLGQWFAAAHVERWWHEPSDPARIRAEYLPCSKAASLRTP